MQLMIVGLMKVLAISLPVSCVDSPLAWSPDGRWLAYTVEDSSPDTAIPQGWLFDSSRFSTSRPTSPFHARDSAHLPVRQFRIWASERAGLKAVLIDQSPWPLSAPAWAPDGQRLAYLRFVPRDGSESLPSIHGHCELVVQDSLDSKRVVLTLPEADLGLGQLNRFCSLQPCWSPDAQLLLFPRLGEIPAVLVVHPGQGRIRMTIVGGTEASWSPEGTRLAVVVPSTTDPSEQRIQLLGPDYSVLRTVKGFGQIDGRPRWSADGQSLLITANRLSNPTRNRGPELIRIQVDTGFTIPILTLASPPNIGRAHALPLTLGQGEDALAPSQISADFDRDQEQCVFAARLPGHEPVIGFCNIRTPMTHKRFAAIDISLGIGVLAMHPDGLNIAVRVGGFEKSGPAFVCNLASEAVSLLAPDPATRREWLATLAHSALGLLETALPDVAVDGRPVQRMSPFPLPGEIPTHSSVAPRLKRLGKLGRGLVQPGIVDASVTGRGDVSDREFDEYRLLFDYLSGDYSAAAEADVTELETRADGSDERLRLLVTRAQILHAQGRTDRALPILNYLLQVQQRETKVVEETAVGRVLSESEDPARGWFLYLAKRLAEPKSEASPVSTGEEAQEEEEIDLRLPARMLGPRGQGIDGRPRGLMPRLPLGPGERPRFGGPPEGRPFEPFNPERMRRAFTPLPPRPFQPVAPLLPRFQRPERPDLHR